MPDDDSVQIKTSSYIMRHSFWKRVVIDVFYFYFAQLNWVHMYTYVNGRKKWVNCIERLQGLWIIRIT